MTTLSALPLNPADRLIVALDVPADYAFDLVRRLRYQVRWYKLRTQSFVSGNGRDLVRYIIKEGNFLMVDAKLYDTHDSVRGDMEVYASLGAHMVTVHEDCIASAVGFGPKVLGVGALTDLGPTSPSMMGMFDEASGIVCHPKMVGHYRWEYGSEKIIVCPGIRPAGTDSNNHEEPCTPGDAIRNGADYLVVGRPIIAAPDPVEATRSIIREIEAAL